MSKTLASGLMHSKSITYNNPMLAIPTAGKERKKLLMTRNKTLTLSGNTRTLKHTKNCKFPTKWPLQCYLTRNHNVNWYFNLWPKTVKEIWVVPSKLGRTVGGAMGIGEKSGHLNPAGLYTPEAWLCPLEDNEDITICTFSSSKWYHTNVVHSGN